MRVHHKNVVPFIGYCQEGDNMALIYEYMALGNLGSHVSGKLHSLASYPVSRYSTTNKVNVCNNINSLLQAQTAIQKL